MSIATNVYLYLGIYIALLLGISYYVSRRQSREDFLIGGRNRGGWQIFASKFAAAIGAGYFISYTGFAYEYGFGVFAMLLGLLLGYLIFAYWASPKIHKGSKEKKFYTIGDFVYDKTGSKMSSHFANISSMAILFSWLLVGIIGGAKIVDDFGFLSYNLAVILTAGVVLIYILMAGFKAVISTDIIQSFIIFILLIVITFGITGVGIGETLSSGSGSIDIGTAVAFLLFGILAVFSSADRYQLAYAAENEKKLKHGLGLAIIPIILSGFFLLLVGIFMASQSPGLDSGLVFTEALKNFLPASLLPFAIVLFFAGVMSSADTSVYSIASHYALSKKDKSIGTIRKAVIVLMIITALLALLFPNVVDVSIFAGSISLTSSLALIYVIKGGRKSKRFIGSVTGGFIGLIFGLAIFGFEPTMALLVIVGSALGLLWKGKKRT